MILRRSSILPWKYTLINVTPKNTGVYILRDSHNSIIYVGIPRGRQSLRNALIGHYKRDDVPKTSFFDWYSTDTKTEAKKLRENWENKFVSIG